MAFTIVYSNGGLRDYGDDDSFTVSDEGVLLIRLQRDNISRHYVAPGGWLEVVETVEGTPATETRAIIGHKPRP